jgi:uncharacterized membrane protein
MSTKEMYGRYTVAMFIWLAGCSVIKFVFFPQVSTTKAIAGLFSFMLMLYFFERISKPAIWEEVRRDELTKSDRIALAMLRKGWKSNET